MSRVLTDSLTHGYAKCEKPNCHYVPSKWPFFKTKAFSFINQNPLDGSQYQLAFPKFRVFMHLWATDFQVYTVGRRAPFRHFNRLSPTVTMPNLNTGSFISGGDLPQLAMPNTHIFHFQNHATHFGCCPMLPSPPSNTKHSIDQPCTHDIPSNTKHIVDLYHALTPMSCDVLVHNVMQSCHCSFIPCYIYDECYMYMPTHT